MDIINVEKRDAKAKGRQLRRNNILPCSVYGGALPEAISIQMDMTAADQLCRTKREGSTIRLALGDQRIPVQIKEIKHECVSGKLEHLCFQALQADHPVNSVAHILLKNAETVPGVLEQVLFEVPFTSLPGDLVDTVTIDLKDRPVGTTITLADIPEFCSDKVTLKVQPDSMILRILEKKRTDDAEEEAAAEEDAQ